MKKKLIIIGSIVLVVLITSGVVWQKSTSWERNFSIKYVERVEKTGTVNTDYYLYEITNKTNKTFKNVDAILKVDNAVFKDFTFNDEIESTIHPGETVEYKIYWDTIEKKAKEKNIYLSMASVEISNIKYK